MFISAVRSAGDLAGVFEFDGETGYFYQYDQSKREKPRIGGAIHVISGKCPFLESEVVVRWSVDEKIVGLFIHDRLWAAFAGNEKFGGDYQDKANPDIPDSVAHAFNKPEPPTSAAIKATRIGCLGALLLSCITLLWAVWWVVRPPLRLHREPGQVRVDVMTLGEYQTTIDRIRLSDSKTGDTIWELKARNGVVQIHGFILKVGQNPSQIKTAFRKFDVVLPRATESFVLQEGTDYRVELWGGATFLSKTWASFHLAQE